MTDSAPRKAPQASTKPASTRQASPEQTSPRQTAPEQGSTGQTGSEQGSTKPTAAQQADAGEADAEQAVAPQAGMPDAHDDKPDMDEVKRKFREALDRKREIHADGSNAGGRDTGKIHDAHGPARSRRDFRRKSG